MNTEDLHTMNINTLYFSATGTTEKIVSRIAAELKECLNQESSLSTFSFTSPEARADSKSYSAEDIVIVGVPVYAGRVPNVLLSYLEGLEGNGAVAIAVVLYGNRNYDDALAELRNILYNKNFLVAGAGAFIGEHSFSTTLAKNRPDPGDYIYADELAKKVAEKINGSYLLESIEVRGSYPPGPYYVPRNQEGNPVDIRKVKPKTSPSCINCKICASICPMGSINQDIPAEIHGICIKCGACIKKCPVQAKYYDDLNYLRHKEELESDFSQRKLPEIFF